MDDFTPAYPQIAFGYGAGTTVQSEPSTPADAQAHRIYLKQPSSHGKLCAVLMPTYEPSTDLLWANPPTDDPSTPNVDESTLMPKETWPKANRPVLVNMGGNRISLIGQELRFDASFSQGDEDALATDASWDFGDGGTATGLIARHTYLAPGTYTVTCTVMGQTGTRAVRVLSALGESDWDISALTSLSGTQEGWSASLLIQAATANIAPFQGVLLYIYDDTDVRWREEYENAFRALARKTAWTAEPAPDPIWDISTVNSGFQNSSGGTSSGGSLAGVGSPTGDTWAVINQYNDLIAQACAREGVPPNLAKAVIYLESGGNANNLTPTGNAACPYAYGLFQIACGCAAVTCPGTFSDMFDPATNIALGAQHLAINYRECNNSWDGAICSFFAGHCVPDGASDVLGTSDFDYVNIVKQHWAEADAATPAVGGGSLDPIFGEVIFDGYVTDIQTTDHKDGTDMTVNLEGSAQILQKLSQRREVFFESSQYGTFGGTLMGGPPMRIATCIHHLLKTHTDYPDRHDVILDWAGPRMTSTTANEGFMWSNFKAWADNDFASVWSDRHGRLRYESKPPYRGKAWYDQAVLNAVLIDPGLVITADVAERTIDARTTWVKLCGLLSNGSCEICGEYPCGGPTSGNAGQWKVQRGFQYDDYRTLCALAAHHYAYLNRRYDLTFQIAWRHDLEVHDLIQLPLKDPSGRWNWANGRAPVFVVTSVSHQYTTIGTWLTTVTAEELTYGVSCVCKEPHCPKTIACATCGSGGNSGPSAGAGSAVCPTDELNGLNWGLWMGTQSEFSGKFVGTQSCVNCSWENVHLHIFSEDRVLSDPRFDTGTYCSEVDVPGPFDNATSDIITGTVGVLTASLTGSTLTNELPFRSINQTEVASWVDITATGPLGYTKRGTLTFTVHPSSVSGIAEIYLIELDAGSNRDSFVAPALPGSAVTTSAVAGLPFAGAYQTLGQLTNTGDSSLSINNGGPSLLEPPIPASQNVMSFDLICAPEGRRYRIGMRILGGGDVTGNQEGPGSCHDYLTRVQETDLFAGVFVGSLNSYEFRPDSEFKGAGLAACVNRDVLTGFGLGGADDFVLRQVSTCTETGNWSWYTHHYLNNSSLTADLQIDWLSCSKINLVVPFGSYGGYAFPTYSGAPIAGTCGNWPTTEKINRRISASEQANQRSSPLHLKGDRFIQYGQDHGINPGVVVAILQRESQLGADGSTLPTTLNNFGGITGSGSCGSQFITDREWAEYCTVEEGLQAVFATLDGPLYRAPGGALKDVMEIYSPASENNMSDLWQIFSSVASDLGINLEQTTQVYATAECTTPAGVLIAAPPAGQPGFGGETTMLEYVMHQSNMIISQGPWGPWSHQNCDCYDFAVVIGTPVYPLIAGEVILAGPTADVYEPNTIVVRTAYGDIRYGHLSSVSVTNGQTVALDTLLGYSGTAGTGPHLHVGLEGSVGGSPKGLTMTQTMQAIGFNIGSFPWEG